MTDLVEPDTATKLKAFVVLEENENTGGIVFASTASKARRLGANEYNDSELQGLSCRRAPWADKWASTKEDVPVQVMISHGWRFECCGCGETICEDWLYDEDLPLEGVIGTQRSMVYCSEICECQEKLRRARAKDYQRRMIEKLSKLLLKRFPEAKITKTHAYATERNGSWQVTQCVVHFKFPGMKIGPASLRFDLDSYRVGPVRPEFNCCFGDKEAFEAWAAETKKSAQPQSHDEPASPLNQENDRG
jgi:hypothetical protein